MTSQFHRISGSDNAHNGPIQQHLFLEQITEEDEELILQAKQELKDCGLARMRENQEFESEDLHCVSFKAPQNIRICPEKRSSKVEHTADSGPGFISPNDGIQARRDTKKPNLPHPIKTDQSIRNLHTDQRQGSPCLISLRSVGPGVPISLTPTLSKVRFSPSAQSQQAVVTTNINGTILIVNDLFCGLVGLPQDNIISTSLFQLISDEYRQGLSSLLKNGKSDPAEKVLQSGKIIRIQKAMEEDDLEVTVSVWLKQKRSESHPENLIFVWVLEAINDLKVEFSISRFSGDITHISGPFDELFETYVDQVAKPKLSQLLPCFDNIVELNVEEISRRKYYAARSFKGRTFPVIVRILDKTEEEVRVELISMSNISGILTLSAEGAIKQANDSFTKHLLGYQKNEVLGRQIVDIVPQFDQINDLVTQIHDQSPAQSPTMFSVSTMRRMIATPSTSSPPRPPETIPSSSDRLNQSVFVIHRDGINIGVQLQLRQNTDNTFALWLSFTRTHGSDLLHQNDPLESPTTRIPLQDGLLKGKHVQNEREPPQEIMARLNLHNNYDFKKDEAKRKFPISIADFEIEKKLGEGAFGFVNLAYSKADPEKKFVVLKYIYKRRILQDSWTRDKELGMVPSEVHILNFLRTRPHPNITKMLSVFQDDQFIYLEMALHGNGMDLFDFIEYRSSLGEAEIRFIFKQACSAIQHLHRLKIVHRDIKDENIVIDLNSRIQLIDFGSAAFFDPNKLFTTFCGTLDYCSPEVITGHAYSGPPQDVWSLGILLYTLIYRENPFFNFDEIIVGHLRIPFILSDESDELLHRILNRYEDERPSIDEILSHPWLK